MRGRAGPAAGPAAAAAAPPPIGIPEIGPIAGRRSPLEQPRLNLLVPSLQQEHVFGGIMTALLLFIELCGRDRDVRIVLTDQSEPTRAALAMLDEFRMHTADADDAPGRLIVPLGDRAGRTLPVRREDRFLATAWWTAYTALRLLRWQAESHRRELLPLAYLIQDHEPGFYPWSSRHALARSTYEATQPLIGIFNTGLLRDYFLGQGYRFAHSFAFEPQLNPALAQRLAQLGQFAKRRQLLLYGRPGTPRNAFELVCQGLRHWSEIDPSSAEWTLLSVGEAHADIALAHGNRIVSRGKLTLDDYAQALAESAIGLSLMLSPHPSYPPLEMAEFGLEVVTNRFANKDLAALGGHIHSLESATPEAIGELLRTLAQRFTQELTPVDRPAHSVFARDVAPFPFAGELRRALGHELPDGR